MVQRRFKPLETNSFFGALVYERIVPQDHFLRQLDRVIPWQRFSDKLVPYYRGKAKEGRPPYDPALLLKMLLIAYLYHLSERQVEELANFHLPVKCFLGLAADEAAPDHSTLTAFKNRLLENGRLEAFEQLLAEVIRIAQEKGIRFGAVQILDSVHTVAAVNVEKDERRQKKEGKAPRDPHAQWGVKRSRRRRGEQGQVVQEEYFYGYKAHVSLNAESGLITSVVHTPGNAYDGHQLPKLVEKDLALGLPVEIVAADRAYDDSGNHEYLASKGLHSAIHLHDYRTQKKDPHKEVWERLMQSPAYQQGLQQRYKIERKFGEAKQQHGLGRCRYVGLIRYAIQGFLTAVVLNLKRMVWLLTGVPFKGRARAVA